MTVLDDLLLKWQAEAAQRATEDIGPEPGEAEIQAALDELHRDSSDDQPWGGDR